MSVAETEKFLVCKVSQLENIILNLELDLEASRIETERLKEVINYSRLKLGEVMEGLK